MYSVSNLGRVRRDAPGAGTKAGRLVTGSLLSNGYRLLHLGRGSRHDKFAKSRHRVVAKAFLGPCPQGKEVNHKDGDKTNDRADNLEYVTHAENQAHASATGLFRTGEAHPHAKLSESKVRKVRRLYRSGAWTQRALAEKFGVNQRLIWMIIHRKIWKGLDAAG